MDIQTKTYEKKPNMKKEEKKGRERERAGIAIGKLYAFIYFDWKLLLNSTQAIIINQEKKSSL